MQDLSLTIGTGEVYGLLGPNGAGKTTTLGMLAGLLRPSRGAAVIAGQPVRSSGEFRRRLGYLQQAPAFPRWLSGREFVEFVAELFGLDASTRRARAGALLERLGLTEAAGRRIGTYSGGMRQRLGLVAALVNDPDVLLLDEPVSGLDPLGRREILDLIREFGGRKTVVMSSHVLDDVDRIATSVGILDRGRLLAHAPIADLRARYAQPAFELEFERPPDGLAGMLRGLAWVRHVLDAGTLLTVTVYDPELAARELPALGVANGPALRRFERRAASLEDVFVQIVGEARR